MTANFRQNTTFPAGDGEAYGYLALPPSGSGPGVILLHEWWGLTDQIAGVADKLAAEGFTVLAPALYGPQVTHVTQEAFGLMMGLPPQTGVELASRALDHLLAHKAVTGTSAGVLGYSMGGGYALALAAAAGEKVAATVAYYGVVNGPDPDFSGVKAKVQGHFGEKDDFADPARAEGLAGAIRAQSGAEVEVHLYPGGHAFANEENHLGTWDEAAASLAWDRTLAFLKGALIR